MITAASVGSMVYDGQTMTRADAIAAAKTDLVAAGVDPFAADEMLVDRSGLVQRAWWDSMAGFVQADYPSAQPVTVVNVVPPA